MAKRTVRGFGMVTYTHVSGSFRTGAYGEVIDVDAKDVDRLDQAGAFSENAENAGPTPAPRRGVDADEMLDLVDGPKAKRG